MSVKSKQIFLAADGTQFDTAEEAEMYESVINLKPSISAWCKKNYNERLVTRYTNLLMFWEASRTKALVAVPEIGEDEETEVVV